MKKINILTECEDDLLLSLLAENENVKPSFFYFNVNRLFLLANHIQRFRLLPNLEDLLIRIKNVTLVLQIEERQVLQIEDSGNLDECLHIIKEEMEYEISRLKNKYRNKINWFLLVDTFENAELKEFIKTM